MLFFEQHTINSSLTSPPSLAMNEVPATFSARTDSSGIKPSADGRNCHSGIRLTGADIAAIVLGSVTGTALIFVIVMLSMRYRQLKKKIRRESNANWFIGSTPLLSSPPPPPPRKPFPPGPTCSAENGGARGSAATTVHSSTPPTQRATLPAPYARTPPVPVVNVTGARTSAVPRTVAHYVHPRPLVAPVHYTYPCPAIELSPATHSGPPTPTTAYSVPPTPTTAHSVPPTPTLYLRLPAPAASRASTPLSLQGAGELSRVSTVTARPAGDLLSRSSSRASSSLSAGPVAGLARRSRGDSIDPHRLHRAPEMPRPYQLGALPSPV